MRGVLKREIQSPFYREGVSYALLKVTELGLVPAAEVLLEFGADLSFEGEAGGKGLGLFLGLVRNHWEGITAGAERGGAVSSDTPLLAGMVWIVAALTGAWLGAWESVCSFKGFCQRWSHCQSRTWDVCDSPVFIGNTALSSCPFPLSVAIRAVLGNPLVLSDSVFLFSDPVTYYTPLHIAVLRNQPDMVELLVHHGADINRRDRVRAQLLWYGQAESP